LVAACVFDPQGKLKRTLQTLYDGTNRLNKRIGAAGQQTVFSFDGNDNALSTTDALGRYATNIWDELDRAKRIGDTGNYTTEVTYDAQDRPLTVTDPRSLTTGCTGLKSPLKLGRADMAQR